MRPVNLVPAELRGGGGSGDPKVAYGIVGGLGVLLVMVLLAVVQSNKATTLRDETAAIQAETQRHQANIKPVQSFNDFADVVQSRTLLVGGLAESRFPWDRTLFNLSRAMPEDVTLDTIIASTSSDVAAAPAAGAAAPEANSATLELTGCASGWYGASRFLVRLKDLPGVSDVTPASSNSDPADNTGDSATDNEEGANRKANCGISPLSFSFKVFYAPQQVDLTGLPKIAGAVPAGATAATTDPAAATAATGAAQ
ncbi:MAG: hypothetical protein WAP35_07885 [Solirubrobacterales bacterium]